MSEKATAAWTYHISYEAWENFLANTFDESRTFVYDLLRPLIEPGYSVAEIGFGQGKDYEDFFSKQDVHYFGFDSTDQFVQYAREKFADRFYSSREFFDLNPGEIFSLCYARDVFEHMDPEEVYHNFRTFLRKSRRYAVVVWFMRPDPTGQIIRWKDGAGFNKEGCYQNTLDAMQLDRIAKEEGFKTDIRRIPTHPHREVWIMERPDANS